MIKFKKTLLIISIVLVLSIISIFTYLFIDSKLYKLECSRINDGEYEVSYFKYGVTKIITNAVHKNIVGFPNEQEARDYYNNFVDSETIVEIRGSNLEFYYNEPNIIGKNLNKINNLYVEMGYECKKVKK